MGTSFQLQLFPQPPKDCQDSEEEFHLLAVDYNEPTNSAPWLFSSDNIVGKKPQRISQNKLSASPRDSHVPKDKAELPEPNLDNGLCFNQMLKSVYTEIISRLDALF